MKCHINDLTRCFTPYQPLIDSSIIHHRLSLISHLSSIIYTVINYLSSTIYHQLTIPIINYLYTYVVQSSIIQIRIIVPPSRGLCLFFKNTRCRPTSKLYYTTYSYVHVHKRFNNDIQHSLETPTARDKYSGPRHLFEYIWILFELFIFYNDHSYYILPST